jgi:ammonia channel protein AmtB
MQNRELFRWAFAASGLWLIIAPFLLLDGTSTLGQGVAGGTGILMVLGLLALIIASLSFSKHDLMRRFSGMVLGLILIAFPWYLGSSEAASSWSAGIIGVILVLVAFYEVYQSEKRYDHF